MTNSLSAKESVAAVWSILNHDDVTDDAGEVGLLAAKRSCDNGQEKPKKPANGPLGCPLCPKVFKRSLNLRRHVTNIHNVRHVDVQSDDGTIKCGFDHACGAAFDRSIFYRRHLHEIHKVKLDKKVLYFDTEDDFEAWKQAEQTQTSSRFTKRCKITPSQRNLKVKKLTFLCSYSASRLRDKLCKRRTVKIDTCCPARIDAIVGKDNVIASYFSTHVGHSMEAIQDYLKRERRRFNVAQRKKRKAYETTKQKTEELCKNLLQKLNDGQFTIEYMTEISQNLENILNPPPEHMQKSLPWGKEAYSDHSDDNHEDGVSIETNEEYILGLSGTIGEKPRALLSDMNASKESDNTSENHKKKRVKRKMKSIIDKGDIMNRVPCLTNGTSLPYFHGKVKQFSLDSKPDDGELEEKVRSHGFLRTLETITPIIAGQLLQKDLVFPEPPPEKIRNLYEDVWNKYRNSLKTSKEDHTYTG